MSNEEFKKLIAGALLQVYRDCLEEGNFTPYAVARVASYHLPRYFHNQPPAWVGPRVINAAVLLRNRTRSSDRHPSLQDALEALHDAL